MGKVAGDDLGCPPIGVASTVSRPSSPVDRDYSESELVIALAGAVGTDLRTVEDCLAERLHRHFGYEVSVVHVSEEIIPELVAADMWADGDECARINSMMNAGNLARESTENNSILALGAASWIAAQRREDDEGNPEAAGRRAYIISSLKRPEEVVRLRDIYPSGFYLIGVYADPEMRYERLTKVKGIKPSDAEALIKRDENEVLVKGGQRLTDTFHLSDFFVRQCEHEMGVANGIWRILDVLFGHPYLTPTFDEYAMFLAFSASLRSADMARQVGAVVAKDGEILATGANDCPRFGGGLYWPIRDEVTQEVTDEPGGRDYTLERDENKFQTRKIMETILDEATKVGIEGGKLEPVLRKSPIKDLTEFGRSVHAEMEALLSCARRSASTKGATLYTTTFPCHNCAKHIVAAGIERVVYVEPYAKSKAAEFHKDSMHVGFGKAEKKVHLEPFVGIGPRRFFDLFSMALGSGYQIERKDLEGNTVPWETKERYPRLQMRPLSYLDLEDWAGREFKESRNQLRGTSAK